MEQPSRFSAANILFAADIPRNRFIGEKPPCAAVRVLNENNCTALYIYTVTVNIRCKFV